MAEAGVLAFHALLPITVVEAEVVSVGVEALEEMGQLAWEAMGVILAEVAGERFS